MKKLVIGLICLLCLTLTMPAEACYGVRAMAMGGAFIAVADDVNTVYWNPAGLSDIKEMQIGWQRAVNNRDTMNYIDVYEIVAPLKKGWSGVGVTYVNDRDASSFGDEGEARDYKSNWSVLSYGTKVNKNFAVGINLRWAQDAAWGGIVGLPDPTVPVFSGHWGLI